jgi:hypothetical protein
MHRISCQVIYIGVSGLVIPCNYDFDCDCDCEHRTESEKNMVKIKVLDWQRLLQELISKVIHFTKYCPFELN